VRPLGAWTMTARPTMPPEDPGPLSRIMLRAIETVYAALLGSALGLTAGLIAHSA